MELAVLGTQKVCLMQLGIKGCCTKLRGLGFTPLHTYKERGAGLTMAWGQRLEIGADGAIQRVYKVW